MIFLQENVVVAVLSLLPPNNEEVVFLPLPNLGLFADGSSEDYTRLATIYNVSMPAMTLTTNLRKAVRTNKSIFKVFKFKRSSYENTTSPPDQFIVFHFMINVGAHSKVSFFWKFHNFF